MIAFKFLQNDHFIVLSFFYNKFKYHMYIFNLNKKNIYIKNKN